MHPPEMGLGVEGSYLNWKRLQTVDFIFVVVVINEIIFGLPPPNQIPDNEQSPYS